MQALKSACKSGKNVVILHRVRLAFGNRSAQNSLGELKALNASALPKN